MVEPEITIVNTKTKASPKSFYFYINERGIVNRNLEDKELESICNIDNLEFFTVNSIQSLKFSSCITISHVGYGTIFNSLLASKIVILSIVNCEKFNNEALKHVSNSIHLTNIKKILLSHNHTITNKGYDLLFRSKNFKSLNELIFNQCAGVDDNTIELMIKEPVPNLIYLSICQCDVSNKIMKILSNYSKNIKNLEYLNLAGSSKINDDGIIDFCNVKDLERFNSLILNNLPLFSDIGLKKIIQSKLIKSLKSLCFSGTSVSNDGFDELITANQQGNKLENISVALYHDIFNPIMTSSFFHSIKKLKLVGYRRPLYFTFDDYSQFLDKALATSTNILNLEKLVIPDFVSLSVFMKSSNSKNIKALVVYHHQHYVETDKIIKLYVFYRSIKLTKSTFGNTGQYGIKYLSHADKIKTLTLRQQESVSALLRRLNFCNLAVLHLHDCKDMHFNTFSVTKLTNLIYLRISKPNQINIKDMFLSLVNIPFDNLKTVIFEYMPITEYCQKILLISEFIKKVTILKLRYIESMTLDKFLNRYCKRLGTKQAAKLNKVAFKKIKYLSYKCIEFAVNLFCNAEISFKKLYLEKKLDYISSLKRTPAAFFNKYEKDVEKSTVHHRMVKTTFSLLSSKEFAEGLIKLPVNIILNKLAIHEESKGKQQIFENYRSKIDIKLLADRIFIDSWTNEYSCNIFLNTRTVKLELCEIKSTNELWSGLTNSKMVKYLQHLIINKVVIPDETKLVQFITACKYINTLELKEISTTPKTLVSIFKNDHKIHWCTVPLDNTSQIGDSIAGTKLNMAPVKKLKIVYNASIKAEVIDKKEEDLLECLLLSEDARNIEKLEILDCPYPANIMIILSKAKFLSNLQVLNLEFRNPLKMMEGLPTFLKTLHTPNLRYFKFWEKKTNDGRLYDTLDILNGIYSSQNLKKINNVNISNCLLNVKMFDELSKLNANLRETMLNLDPRTFNLDLIKFALKHFGEWNALKNALHLAYFNRPNDMEKITDLLVASGYKPIFENPDSVSFIKKDPYINMKLEDYMTKHVKISDQEIKKFFSVNNLMSQKFLLSEKLVTGEYAKVSNSGKPVAPAGNASITIKPPPPSNNPAPVSNPTNTNTSTSPIPFPVGNASNTSKPIPAGSSSLPAAAIGNASNTNKPSPAGSSSLATAANGTGVTAGTGTGAAAGTGTGAATGTGTGATTGTGPGVGGGPNPAGPVTTERIILIFQSLLSGEESSAVANLAPPAQNLGLVVQTGGSNAAQAKAKAKSRVIEKYKKIFSTQYKELLNKNTTNASIKRYMPKIKHVILVKQAIETNEMVEFLSSSIGQELISITLLDCEIIQSEIIVQAKSLIELGLKNLPLLPKLCHFYIQEASFIPNVEVLIYILAHAKGLQDVIVDNCRSAESTKKMIQKMKEVDIENGIQSLCFSEMTMDSNTLTETIYLIEEKFEKLQRLRLIEVSNFSIHALIQILKSPTAERLTHFSLTTNQITTKYFEAIGHAETLFNLIELEIGIPDLSKRDKEILTIDKIYNIENEKLIELPQVLFDTFRTGFQHIIQSSTLKSVDWSHLFIKNIVLITEHNINLALTHKRFINVTKFLIMTKNIKTQLVKDILTQIQSADFDVEHFINTHPRFINATICKCLINKFQSGIQKASLKRGQSLKVDIFNMLANNIPNLISNINYTLEFRKNEINDDVIDILCAFSDILIQNRFRLTLTKTSNLVAKKGLNSLIQTFYYDDILNQYHWVIEEQTWLNLIDYKSLNIIVKSLQNPLRLPIKNFDLSNNYCLTSDGMFNTVKSKIMSIGNDQNTLIPIGRLDQFIQALQNESFKYESRVIDDNCGKLLIQLLTKLPNIKTLNVANKNFGDGLCKEICYYVSTQQYQPKIETVYLVNNPRITSIGLKYLYTSVVGNAINHRKLRSIDVTCLEELKPDINVLLNKGLDDALTAKYEKYRRLFKERGIGYYDSDCKFMVFYSIICIPFACLQYWTPYLSKKAVYKAISKLKRKIEGLIGIKRQRYKKFNLYVEKTDVTKFIFNKNILELNSWLSNKVLWLLMLINAVVYYIMCVIAPAVFHPKTCSESQPIEVYFIYAAYASLAFIFEASFFLYIIYQINDKNILKLSIETAITLVTSQIGKFSLFNDIIFITTCYICEYYVIALVSSFFLLWFALINLTQIASNMWSIYQDYKNGNIHYTSYLNFFGEISYNLEMKAIANTLERFTTASTIRYKQMEIPQIIFRSLMKFFLENLPLGIAQAIVVMTRTKDSLSMLISLTSSFASLLIAFHTAITAKPSICTHEMVNSLNLEDFRNDLEVLGDEVKLPKHVSNRISAVIDNQSVAYPAPLLDSPIRSNNNNNNTIIELPSKNIEAESRSRLNGEINERENFAELYDQILKNQEKEQLVHTHADSNEQLIKSAEADMLMRELDLCTPLTDASKDKNKAEIPKDKPDASKKKV